MSTPTSSDIRVIEAVRGRRTSGRRRGRQGGQILVIVVLGLVAIIGGVALVLEGSNAYAQQRLTQNATDAAAEAGALTLGSWMADSAAWHDGDVKASVDRLLAANSIEAGRANYTNRLGQYINSGGGVVTDPDAAALVGGGSIPAGAKGVRVEGNHNFPTYLARVLDIDSFTAHTSSTAIAGPLTGGVFLPIVFPVSITNCENNGELGVGEDSWHISAPGTPPVGQEYILPLCKAESGNFMVLDLDKTQNCYEEVVDPPAVQWDLPIYVDGDNGNECAKKISDGIFDANLIGKIVTVPVCDAVCAVMVGSHTQYHIIKVASFYLAGFSDTNNPNNSECKAHDGIVPIVGNGSSSCVIGWFVRWVTVGPVGKGEVGNSDAIGVQLIR